MASLAKATQKPNIIKKLLGHKPINISLEITCLGQEIRFIVVGPKELDTFLVSQISAAYPTSRIERVKDYLSEEAWPNESMHIKTLQLTSPAFYPIKTYQEFKEIDPLAQFLGTLSKASKTDSLCLQIILSPASSDYASQASKALAPDSPKEGPKPSVDPSKKIIEQKVSIAGVAASLRLIASNNQLISEMAQSLYIFNRPDGNSFAPHKPLPWNRSKLISAVRSRKFVGSHHHVLNLEEIATLWHLPGETVKVANIAWSSGIFSDPPSNLPVVPPSEADASEKLGINFFARTQFRNLSSIFGIKNEDRMRHTYIIGKSGTGKSTLLENMAIDDFKKDRGVAFIDPHGDGAESLLNYVPSHRINQTIYFNPADREYPISLNILEVQDPSQAEFVASGIVSIFHKLYGKSWGPRLEYILRNTVLTLCLIPGSTLVDVPNILTDSKFRSKCIGKITDPILLNFWNEEYNRMSDNVRLESISSILNKVGQFVTSPLIRSVIGHQKSTINLEKVMNEGHILLCNLSQGKLGEDNAALLGAMIITKLELAALNRVHVAKEQRKDFYLYVDEFQNFATGSFIKILAEARKFRLGLILANQYIAQIPEEIQKAIFGNAGTIVSFVLGAEDARVLEQEFGEAFTQNDLVALKKHEIALKLTIDGEVSRPFLATTLPPLKSRNQNREKVIKVSRERYSVSRPHPTSVTTGTQEPQLTDKNAS